MLRAEPPVLPDKNRDKATPRSSTDTEGSNWIVRHVVLYLTQSMIPGQHHLCLQHTKNSTTPTLKDSAQ